MLVIFGWIYCRIKWRAKNPLGDGGIEIHNWMFKQKSFLEHLGDDIHNVLEKAKKDAGSKDVRISGGANVIQQFLNAGLIDEFNIHLTPIILISGVKLFDKIDKEKFSIQILEVVNSENVTHLKYKLNNNEDKDKS